MRTTRGAAVVGVLLVVGACTPQPPGGGPDLPDPVVPDLPAGVVTTAVVGAGAVVIASRRRRRST